MTTDEKLTTILVSVARMEERQEASVHRSKNIAQQMDALGMKIDRCPTKEDLQSAVDPVKERVIALEEKNSWAIKTLAVACLSGLVSGIGYVLKNWIT